MSHHLGIRGGDLLQTGPAKRVGPGRAQRPAAFIAWTGRGALPAEPVPGVQPPQTTEVSNPFRRVIDDHGFPPVSYTHLRAHETPEHLVCRLLLDKKKN